MRILQPISRRVALAAHRAFSLVEVVVAVGIFAIAIVSIIGLLVPITKSVADIGETDDASRVAGVIVEQLQSAGFDRVRGFLNSPPLPTNRLHASRDGRRIGRSDDSSVWDPPPDDLTTEQEKAQQFFEINLTRNTALSPAADDASSAYIAYFLELRWPGYTGAGVQMADRRQQSVLLIPAVVNR